MTQVGGESVRFGSIVYGIRHPGWGWGRFCVHALSLERAARWRGFKPLEFYQQQLHEITAGSEKPVFVFPYPSVAWGYLFQRPQQMARALARLGCTVLYAADTAFRAEPDRSVRGFVELEPNLYLFDDGRNGQVVAGMSRPPVVWCYWPQQAGFLQHVPAGTRLVYDCVDEVDLFDPYPRIRQDHAMLLQRADLVLATADRLLEKVRPVRSDAILVPNACVYDDFARPVTADVPGLAALRAQSRVLIGYYGALAEWIDWDLIREVARTRRDWTVLLVGDDWTNIARKQRMQDEPNVHVWPRQSYNRLGRLLAAFDVAVVPFRVNAITRSVSPIKLFEYMAGGKPIVAAPLDECRKYPQIRLAANPQEFITQVEWCLKEGQSGAFCEQLQAAARENTWEMRARQTLAAMGLP